MSMLNNETDSRNVQQHEREAILNIGSVAGKLSIADQDNDVFCAINKMGGNQLAARILDVSMNQIDEWIERCYVPDPFVALIDKHTGYLAYSLQ